jgi:PAS domain S-box-containing protein
MPRDHNLREQAEKLLSKKVKSFKKMDLQDSEMLIHELEVHQIELEMQNEELRKAQIEIEESRTMFSSLYDFAPIGYFTFDQQGVIEGVNLAGAKFLNVERGLLLNKPFNLFIAPESRDEFHLHRTKVFSTGTKQSCELKFLKKDGSYYASLDSIALKDEKGKKSKCLSAVIDITERKRAEEIIRISYDEMEKRVEKRTQDLKNTSEKLARSNAELREFAYAASHDLQEPLRMISSYVKLLEKRYKGKLDEKADTFIGFIVDGAKRMYEVIKDLLEYSQVEMQGKMFGPTDFSSALEQALSALKSPIEESDAVITHDALPTLMADASQIVRLFQNLISNAIKFHGVKVHVSAEQKENEWVFSVSDNGIGIDPQFTKRIFAIFQRLHTREEYPGTGIGLTISARIVERHGGKIWVESAQGKGSTFYFTIPGVPR